MTIIRGQDDAARACQAYITPRMLWLKKLRSYVDGTQYDNRKPWHDKSVPVWDRAPVVVWQATEGAITSNEDLLLGEGRYPSVTSRPDEDEEGESGEALDEESSEKLDRLIRSIEREAKLRAHNREQYNHAQSVGTCVGIFGVRNGRLFAEAVQAEFCAWELDANCDAVKLTISYPYVDLQRDPDGQWRAKAMLYKRVIDSERDTVYLPAEAQLNGIEPTWVEDKKQSGRHGLGFCPALVHRFRSTTSIVNQIDGNAIHATTLDEQDAYNLQASTRHEGAIHSLPQKYEIGVDPGYNPTGDAGLVDPGLVATASGKGVNPISNPIVESYSPRKAPQGARKQGPGNVWQYQNPETKVGQLELNDGALKSLADTMADLKARIAETLCWVALNPEEIKFAAALSGKALERLMARQLNRVAKDRDGFGNGYILRAYSMLLRIAEKLGASLKTRGIGDGLPVLKTFAAQSGEWQDPPLSLRWGAWFQPIPEDDEKLVNMTDKAYASKFITLRTAVEKLSRTFGIENVDAYLESLEEEAEKRAEQEQDDLAGSIATAHAKLNGATGKQASSGKPGANSENGGSRDSVAPPTKKKAAAGEG